MRSSGEEAIKQLLKWMAQKPAPKIRAILSASALTMYARGFLSMNSEDVSEVLLVLIDDKRESVALTVPWSALTPVDSPIFEPLKDLPDESKLEVDFFVSVTFELPFGQLELQEIADDEEVG